MNEKKNNIHDVDDEYETDDRGYIISPGKFEGEPSYVPYLWSRVLKGEAHTELFVEGGQDVIHVHIEDADRLLYPALKHIDFVDMWESENGFVFSASYTHWRRS